MQIDAIGVNFSEFHLNCADWITVQSKPNNFEDRKQRLLQHDYFKFRHSR